MTEEATKDEFVLRPYQSEILETAIEKNTIIYLPTGAGKTYIAVMLINRLSHSLVKPQNKISVLLVNTVPLVEQHCMTIKRHTDFEVGQFTGDQNVDYWTKDQWITQFAKHQVVVMTAQIFLDVLRHGFFNLQRVNLIIFDECHQAVNDQPMRQIMQLFENINDTNKPRVLGLTATLLNGNCQPNKVADEVRSLEKTFHGKIATVRKLEHVIGFSTNPKEKVVNFADLVLSEVITKVVAMLNDLKDFISSIKFNSNKDMSPRKLLNRDNDSKAVTRIIKILSEHIVMFGAYGGSKATLASLIQVERLKRQAEDSFLEKIFCVMRTTLSSVLKLLEDSMSGFKTKNQIFKFSTSQILTLIEILRPYQAEADNLCGIIFVKQRFTAKILYYTLKSLSESDSDFGFIRTDFIVGFNADSGDRETREAFFSAKINKKIINSFRNNEINLLIASSVLEEGIDIPRCTLVVKFDRPMDYRSYIQSKGRARHGDSIYYIMVPQNERSKYEKSYSNFQYVEKLLQNILVGKTDEREAPTEHEIQRELYDDHDVPPYYVNGPDSPHVSAVSAISLLNRYCQSLQYDKYALLAPNWYLEKYNMKYVVIIEMPIMCLIKEPIRGLPMDTKIAAKRSAALEVCKKLHQIGELTDRLLPRTETENEMDFEYLFTHWLVETVPDDVDGEERNNIPKPGTKKFIRKHKIHIPRCLIAPKTNTYYLHPILMEHPNTMDDRWDKSHKLILQNLLYTRLDYALLTRGPIPNFCQFPIFVSAGKLNIQILQNYTTVSLNENEISDLKKFNYFLFTDILRVLKEFLIYDNEENFGFMIVVPIINNITVSDVEDNFTYSDSNIDFAIDFDTARENTSLLSVNEPSTQTKMNLSVTEESHLGKIINPWYRTSDPYVVLQVCTDMNALSKWPNDEFDTYQSYYDSKYGHTLYNPIQPLLFVRKISRRLCCILPRASSLQTGNKRDKQAMQEGMEEHLIPEMCILQKFPGTLWYKAHCLPTIIHRVVSLLQTEDLRTEICNAIVRKLEITKSSNVVALKKGMLGIDERSRMSVTGEPINRIIEQTHWREMPVDARVLHKEEKKHQPIQQRTVTEVDTASIMPSSSQVPSKRLTNKDYTCRMLDKQYNWKIEDEPVDIDRNIENITLLQIMDFDHFVKEKYSYADMEKINNSPKASKYPALTFEQEYKETKINMINAFSKIGPEQWEILQCLTANNAKDIINLERLETLGDSLLKLSSTLFLFLKYPELNEGRLTHIKGKMIGNRNLLYCGLQKNLGGYMKVSEFSPNSDWMPPSFCVPEILREKINTNKIQVNKLYAFGVPLEEQLKGELFEETIEEFNDIIIDLNSEECMTSEPITTMNKFLGLQNVQDKTVSDCVEALIGAFLHSNGLEGGLSVIEWFNIIPSQFNPTQLFSQVPPDPLIHPFITSEQIDFHIPNYVKLEEHLGYTFNNRAYLLQALSHASYSHNRLTECYQRLEFLGDAVIDFLITSHIFEISDSLTPGELTDLRSALVNNVTFAVLAVRNGFHKHLKYNNTKLMDAIEMFVKFQEERDYTINEETLILVEEHPMYIAEYVHVPKALGDLFESLVGAVFLDSGMDLHITWRVFHRLMWREIETFRYKVPKSPVRMLYECVSAAPRFEKAHVIQQKVTMVRCSIMVNGKKHEVHGFGENKTQAKRAAAKLALRLLSFD